MSNNYLIINATFPPTCLNLKSIMVLVSSFTRTGRVSISAATDNFFLFQPAECFFSLVNSYTIYKLFYFVSIFHIELCNCIGWLVWLQKHCICSISPLLSMVCRDSVVWYRMYVHCWFDVISCKWMCIKVCQPYLLLNTTYALRLVDVTHVRWRCLSQGVWYLLVVWRPRKLSQFKKNECQFG